MLMALFADKPEFEDEEAAVRFLSRAVSADDPKILSRLLAWTRSILDELAKLGSVACICRNTAADLNRALEPFTQQTDFPEIEGTALDCSVWPFVRLVKKSLSNPVLAKGNVLVDLPGELSLPKRSLLQLYGWTNLVQACLMGISTECNWRTRTSGVAIRQ